MSGPSLSPDTLPAFVADAGYEIIASAYNPAGERWRTFSRIISPDALRDRPYGHRWISADTDAYPLAYEDGEMAQSATYGQGYARQIGSTKYRREISIPYDLLDAVDAKTQVFDLVTNFLTKFSAYASQVKDIRMAQMLQKGTLAAGSEQWFDQSYRGAPDSNAGFIYDGKPMFAASGNAHPLKFATNSGSQGVNLDAALNLATAADLNTAYNLATVTNAVDEAGRQILLRPTHVVVGSAMRGVAMSALESQNLPGTAQNDINYNKGLLTPFVFDLLTDDANAWWLLTQGQSFSAVDTGAPVIRSVRDDRRNLLAVSAEFRFGITVEDWRYSHCFAKATT
jgi:hypothetical protein